jgi:DNA uptake protein ComE-like DNA-binding protein
MRRAKELEGMLDTFKAGAPFALLLSLVLLTPASAQTPSPAQSTPTTARPAPATAPATVAPSVTAPATQAAPLIDINSAGKDELDALPGIGPVRAEAIIKGRPYKGKDDLLSRKILPESIYNGIRERVVARQS